MKKVKLFMCTMIILSLSFGVVGCTFTDKIQVKLGWKNEDFEYLKTSSVERISIQSTRDLGFKFIVTDNHAIEEMYSLLRNAKNSEIKSELEPDYIFRFELGEEIKAFYYTVGGTDGNFYNDDVIYSVSNRLDEGIMQNLSVIRKPKNFEDIYYNTILDVINLKKDEFSNGDHKIGVDIQGDVDVLKYVFSYDLKQFLEDVKKIVPNVEMVKNNTEDFDVVISLKNRGYSTTEYKTKISVNNKKDKIQDDFYVIGEYKFKEWNYEISEANKVPQGW